jgi:hypothetical protein
MRPDLMRPQSLADSYPLPLFSLSNQVLTGIYRSYMFNLEHKNIHKDTYNVSTVAEAYARRLTIT